MKINYEGKEIEVDIIGRFEINKKQYTVCSYDDDENQKIIIVETVNDEKGLHIKEIPDEEIETVTNYFNMIKEKLLEE